MLNNLAIKNLLGGIYMNSEKILDLLYDVRTENIGRKEGMKGEEILKKRDFLAQFLKDNINHFVSLSWKRKMCLFLTVKLFFQKCIF